MQCFIRYKDTARDLRCFSRMLISNVHKSIIVMNSLDTRFSKNVFEAVQKTRSTCFIGSKTTRLCLMVLNLIKHSCSFFKHYLNQGLGQKAGLDNNRSLSTLEFLVRTLQILFRTMVVMRYLSQDEKQHNSACTWRHTIQSHKHNMHTVLSVLKLDMQFFKNFLFHF